MSTRAEPGQSRILQQSWLSPAHKRLHAAELFGLPETTSGDEIFTPRNPHLRQLGLSHMRLHRDPRKPTRDMRV